MLQSIRSMWEFASVMQYIYIFGKVIKIDEEFDIEVRFCPYANAQDTWNIAGGVVLMIGMANLMDAGL